MVNNIDFLNKIKNNILKWYEFKENSSILQLGNDIKINNASKSISLIQFSEEDLSSIEDKFDYIIIFDNIKDEIIKLCKRILKEDGILITIFDNPFGISKFSSIIEGNEIDNLEFYEFNYKNIVKKIDMKYSNIYFPFPNYKQCCTILSEKNLVSIDSINIHECLPYYTKEIILFNEINLLSKIYKTNYNLFLNIVNSYFIESSNNESLNNTEEIYFNNLRKDKYQIVTLVKENVIKKIALNEESKKHISNILDIQEKFNNNQIELLDYKEKNEFYSKRIKNQIRFDFLLAKKSNIDEICESLNKFIQPLYNIAVLYEQIEVDKLNHILKNSDETKLKKMHYLKNAFWDMVPKNCFYVNNKFCFFDQEWMENFLPVEFIIYRSIINSYDLIKNNDATVLFKAMKIDEFIDLFKELDDYLRNEIINNEMITIYNSIYNNRRISDLVYREKVLYNNNCNLKEEILKKENYIKELEENNKKQDCFIKELEENNRNQDSYIKELEENNKKQDNYIKVLEEIIENSKPKRRKK